MSPVDTGVMRQRREEAEAEGRTLRRRHTWVPISRISRNLIHDHPHCAILFAGSFWVSVAAMAVAITGINGARAIFWTIPPRFLTGMAAAGGLAFINSIGTTGGFVGPYVMGWLTDETGSFSAGLLAMSGFLVLAAVLAWSLRRFAPGE